MSLPSAGVETFNNVEYHIFSWSSALISGQAEIEDHKHLICAVDEVKMVDTVTLKELADFMEWNLSVMESGRHPFLNHLGQELDGPVGWPTTARRHRLRIVPSMLRGVVR